MMFPLRLSQDSCAMVAVEEEENSREDTRVDIRSTWFASKWKEIAATKTALVATTLDVSRR